MNSYNPDMHHRRSIRLKGYDYSQAGLYYITICIDNHKRLFGRINTENVMILNEAGKNVRECWLQIPDHFPNVVLHDFIVMPNHIHGILELIKSANAPVGVENFQPLHLQNDNPVGVQNFEPLQTRKQYQDDKSNRNEFQKIIPHSIGSIVRGFKTGVTKWFRNNTDIENIWQRNYYEIIIRDDLSYQRISDYIISNPKNWRNDDYFIDTDSNP